MPLNLYTSNRMEHLVTVLSEIVKEPLKLPFDQEIIIIQNRGMQRWLSMQLASKLKIWANCRYPFPSAYIHELFTATIPEAIDNYSFDPQILVWKIMQTLPNLLSTELFKPLSIYLDDSEPVKLFQLSNKIADLFDQYSIYRPEMVLNWENEKENNWQAQLWRAVLPESTIHRAKLKQIFLNRLLNGTINRALFPKRIAIFGISALPAFYLELFNAISSITEVNFLILNPCAEYWDDILSEKEITRIVRKSYRKRKLTGDNKKLHFDQGNSLLSSWGKFGRDFLSCLHEYSPEEYSLPVNPQETTLLSMLQSDILNLNERGTPECPLLPIDHNDRSVQIHCCHSPMREVEILHDNILNFFNIYPDLKPSDIIVMSPEIETYAPFINAVFGSENRPDMKIPFSLADRSMRVESTLIETFIALLELPGSRFTVTSIIDLLEIKQIQSAFSISEEDVPIIKNWIVESGIRWGIDMKSKEQFNLPAFDENTWSYGLNRLLLGFSLPSGENLSYENIAGYDHIEGSQSELLGNIVDFVQSLVEFNSQAAMNHSLPNWSKILLELLNRFFKIDQNEEQDILFIRIAILELNSIASELNYPDEIHFEIIKKWFISKLLQQSFKPGFITGGITFCAMLPMRSIPFKIVCILGLNDSFPRHTSSFSWNLITTNPKIGDHCLQQEDRYLFLESILSARDLFYISYIGQSPHDNILKQPSVVIEELMDYIDKSFYIKAINSFSTNININKDKGDYVTDDLSNLIKTSYGISPKNYLTTAHHLQAFNSKYFLKGSNLFSFSDENFQALMQTGFEHNAKPPFFSKPLPDPDNSFKSLQINDLIKFFKNPSRFILNKRTGITLETQKELFLDDEPFDLQGIDNYKIAEKLVKNLLNGESLEHCFNQFKITGLLPHGTIGKYYYDMLSRQVNDFVGDLNNLQTEKTLDNLFIDNDLCDYHITGTIDTIRENHLLQFRYAQLKPSDLLHAWIKHLILNQFGTTGYPRTSLLLSRGKCLKFIPVEKSEVFLHNLLNLYWSGLSFPLQFFPNSSWEYAEQFVTKMKPEEYAYKMALKKWEGDDYSTIPAESNDPYHALCFESSNQFTDDFRKTSLEIFQPLISHIEQMEMTK